MKMAQQQLPWRGLYAILDPAACRGRDALAVAEAILAGGCAVLQLRDKRRSPAELTALAVALHARCRDAGVPFVINDHIQLAVSTHAEGLHLGQSDPSIEHARALVQPGTIVGLSTHTLAQALDAQARAADLIGFGPIFETRSKEQADPVTGLDALRATLRAVRIPVVAIGGITRENVARVADTGVAMAAAISALCAADDPEAAARAMHEHLISTQR
jgi:thiamine-phosphate diphosphorylase